MTKELYTIKDTIKGTFGKIIETENVKLLERELKEAVEKNQIAFVTDQQLWKLGSIDTKTGIIISEIDFVKNISDYKTIKKGK